jgi:hypothetical protein
VEEKVIPILRVADAGVAVAWYRRVGFEQTDVHRFEPGLPAFVTIERGPMKVFLSEHKGDATPDTLIYLANKASSCICSTRSSALPVTDREAKRPEMVWHRIVRAYTIFDR